MKGEITRCLVQLEVKDADGYRAALRVLTVQGWLGAFLPRKTPPQRLLAERPRCPGQRQSPWWCRDAQRRAERGGVWALGLLFPAMADW